MNTISVFFFLFLTNLAAAGEMLRWQQLEDKRVEFVVLHGDGAVFQLEKFAMVPGGWQDRLTHRSYFDRELALAEFQKSTEGFRSGPLPSFLTRSSLLPSRGKIWESPRSWDQNWEVKFSQWMSDTASATYLTKYNVATDCADAAMAFRWIFARIHGLPAAATLGGSGALFSNFSLRREWENLPTHSQWHRDQRFLTALDYLLQNAYTHSLMRDLYPVKIDRWGVAPGTIFLHLYSEESGHTEIFHKVGRSVPGAIRVLASTVPRRVQDLSEYTVMDWGDYPERGLSGLFRFRWPLMSGNRITLMPTERMPLFSEEQYGAGFGIGYENFIDAVIKKTLPNYQADLRALLRSRTLELLDKLKQRVKIVNDGYAFCSSNDCAEGTPGWEAWSTPSRDRSLLRVIWDAEEIYESDECDSSCKRELESRSGEAITSIRGRVVTLDSAIRAFQDGRASSDPRDSVTDRWGQ